MIVVATLLIAVGLLVALLGGRLFRALLPVIGFVSGAMVGFIGAQAVFGSGAVATSIAIVVALIVGLLLAVLAFVFFEIAIIVYIALLGAAALSYLGVALGLSQDGFVVFMLSVAGALLAGIWASSRYLGLDVIIVLTSFVGVAYVLAGIMLLAGNVTVDELNENGVGRTIVGAVEQSFLWLLVWVGASLAAVQLQHRTVVSNLFRTALEYDDKHRSVL